MIRFKERKLSILPPHFVAAWAAILVLAAAGCAQPEGQKNTSPQARKAGRGPQAGPQGSPNGRSDLPPMAVGVQAAERGDIATYYRSTASLDPDKQAEVLARVNGVIETILVEEGDTLAAGEEMLVIQDAEYRHRVRQAEVEMRQQRLSFERTEKMAAQGLVSAEENDISLSDLEAAEANWELAKLELSYTRVRAPFSGRVVARSVDQGRTVSNGTVLFTMADTGRLLARVHVPAREFRRIQTNQPVQLVVDSTGDNLEGRIDLVSPVIDPTAGTIKVTVEVLRYPPSTRSGDFAEVSIVTDRHADTILVPRLAVLTDHQERVVYVVDGDHASRRVVEVGFEDDRHTEILSGLDEGEIIVVQGQRSLSDDQPIKIVDRLNLDSAPEDTDPAVAAEPDA